MKTAGGLTLGFITAGTACSQERASVFQVFQDGFGLAHTACLGGLNQTKKKNQNLLAS